MICGWLAASRNAGLVDFEHLNTLLAALREEVDADRATVQSCFVVPMASGSADAALRFGGAELSDCRAAVYCSLLWADAKRFLMPLIQNPNAHFPALFKV